MTTAAVDSAADWHIEVFYDGQCPLCQREIRMLRRLDRKRRIRFTDIAATDFEPREYEKTAEDFMSEIHGRLPDGTWIVGVEVFRRLYAAVGFSPAVWASRMPLIAPLLDWGYRIFARNRLRWTRRGSHLAGECHGKNCSI